MNMSAYGDADYHAINAGLELAQTGPWNPVHGVDPSDERKAPRGARTPGSGHRDVHG